MDWYWSCGVYMAIDPARPEAGRLLRADVDQFLDGVWSRVEVLLREEDLRAIPTLGSRHNVFLGMLTVAAYHTLLDLGVERRYAMELFADVGWKIYAKMIGLPFLFAKMRTRDPQRRMNLVLEGLMRFPFNASGRPGYEVRAWADAEEFHTHWTYCAPLGFVKRHVQRHGGSGAAVHGTRVHHGGPHASPRGLHHSGVHPVGDIERALRLVHEPEVRRAQTDRDAADHEHPARDLKQPRRRFLLRTMEQHETRRNGEDLQNACDITKKLGHGTSSCRQPS